MVINFKKYCRSFRNPFLPRTHNHMHGRLMGKVNSSQSEPRMAPFTAVCQTKRFSFLTIQDRLVQLLLEVVSSLRPSTSPLKFDRKTMEYWLHHLATNKE